MKKMILGIDISKDTFDAAVIPSDGLLFKDMEETRHRKFSNNMCGFSQLVGWLNSMNASIEHACMEATSTYGNALAEYLFYAGYLVSMVNAKRVTHYRRSELARIKTDKNDAMLIARFCRAQHPAPWIPLSRESNELRELTGRLADVEQMIQQEKNRIQTPGLSEYVIMSIARIIDTLESEKDNILNRMKNLINSEPEMTRIRELLCSIPGIGEKTAICMMGIIADFGRFKTARQLAAWAGLTPSRKESGTSLRGKAYMSKVGCADIRRLLYMPALAAMRSNPVVQQVTDRLKSETNLAGKQIVVAAMHKLIRIAHGVVTKECEFDPNYSHSS